MNRMKPNIQKDPMTTLKPRLAAGLIAAAVFTLAGCSTAGINDAASKLQSQGAPILTNLTEQAQQLGEKAKSAAENAKTLATEFIDGIKGTTPLDPKAFESAWASLKNELQTMADNAASEETKAKINELKANLEVQFKDLSARIDADENVQDLKAALADFWTQARTKISELTK